MRKPKIDDPKMFEKALDHLNNAREIEHDYIHHGIDYAYDKHVKNDWLDDFDIDKLVVKIENYWL